MSHFLADERGDACVQRRDSCVGGRDFLQTVQSESKQLHPDLGGSHFVQPLGGKHNLPAADHRLAS